MEAYYYKLAQIFVASINCRFGIERNRSQAECREIGWASEVESRYIWVGCDEFICRRMLQTMATWR